ncbi:Uncharacterised protein r2_g2334 [Pycnogonum litorale]
MTDLSLHLYSLLLTLLRNHYHRFRQQPNQSDISIYKEVGYSAHPRTSERIVKSLKGQTDVISQPVTESDFDPRSPNEDSDYSVHPRRSERTVKPPTRLIDSM